MLKITKYEKVIYIVIYLLFFIVGFFPICLPISSKDTILSSYYYCLYSSISLSASMYGIILETLLFINIISAIISSISLIYQLLKNSNIKILDFAFGITTVIFATSGMIYASLTDTLLPFGMIILGISVGIAINKLIFHYGLRGLKY